MKEISREIIAEVDRKVCAIKRREGVSFNEMNLPLGVFSSSADCCGGFYAFSKCILWHTAE